MPELPEVETYTRYFAAHALHRRVIKVGVRDERILGTRKEKLVRAIRGSEFESVRRHGKHLFANAGTQWLHLHFGMSGDLLAYRDVVDQPRYARVIFDFADGTHLAFDDMRLFGVVELTPDPDLYIAEHGLGPDPLSAGFRLPQFRQLLVRRRGAIKSLLLSQDIIAGVGNLYADEALFQSAVDPGRAVDGLSGVEVRVLHAKLRGILKEAVKRRTSGRELPAHWLTMHREVGARCPLCGGLIARTVVFGRTTFFCASHQQ